MSSRVLTVNVGIERPNPYKSAKTTGIDKRPVDIPVEVRAPGSKSGGLGSGLVGDVIGDRKHHGGDHQAVYAFAREDLDAWADRWGEPIDNGYFGENLTTTGIDPNTALLGEIWQVGAAVRLQVTVPRIPCATFRGWTGRRGWAKEFTAQGRPGAYFSVQTPGPIGNGDPIRVIHRPDHAVSIAIAFAALTTEPALLADLAAAGDYLTPELRAVVTRSTGNRSSL